MRTLLLCAAALTASLLLAQAASAASVKHSGRAGVLDIVGGTAANDLDVDFCDAGACAGRVLIRDRADALQVDSLSSSCTPRAVTVRPGAVVSCAAVTRVGVELGEGDDRLTVDGSGAPGRLAVPMLADGGAGNDVLVGGAAADELLGGLGDDAIEARDAAADRVDCGDGLDRAQLDAVDSATGCEPPPAGAPVPPPPAQAPSAPVLVPLRQMVVGLGFAIFPEPGATSRFTRLVLRNLPRGSQVRVRCIGRCGGAKAFTKRAARRSMPLNRFERRFRPGTRIEAVVSHPDFVTQVKTLTVLRNRDPRVVTRCVAPGSARRARCGG